MSNNPPIPTNNVAPPSGEATSDSTRETLQSAHIALVTIVEQLEAARTAIVQQRQQCAQQLQHMQTTVDATIAEAGRRLADVTRQLSELPGTAPRATATLTHDTAPGASTPAHGATPSNSRSTATPPPHALTTRQYTPRHRLHQATPWRRTWRRWWRRPW